MSGIKRYTALMAMHTGGCHCGAVRYEVDIELDKVFECNCSHCSKKGFLLAFVNKDAFTLLSSEDMLMEYFFNKQAIRHLFCRVCGTQSYAEGVAHPQVAINVRCLDGVDLSRLTIKRINGKDV